MKIKYKNNKVKNQCTIPRIALKQFNKEVYTKLFATIGFIEEANSFEDIIKYSAFHFHPLVGNLKGNFALDLGRKLGYRMIIKAYTNEETQWEGTNIYTECRQIEVVLIEEVSNHYE